MTRLENHIEAILFLAGEPTSISRLAKILRKTEKDIDKAIKELEENLKTRGIRLLKKDKKIMLGTAPESSKYCEALTKEELNKNLGQAGLETLAIILYRPDQTQEISKSDIDFIRGVNSNFTLRNLMIKGLIERKTNPLDKRGYVYSPSIQLLQTLGINKKESLPAFNNFTEQLKNVIEPSKNY